PPIVAHVLTQSQVLEVRLLAAGHRQFVAAGYRKTRDLAALNSGAPGLPEVDARNYTHVRQIEVSAGRSTAAMTQTGVTAGPRGPALAADAGTRRRGLARWDLLTAGAAAFRRGHLCRRGGVMGGRAPVAGIAP